MTLDRSPFARFMEYLRADYFRPGQPPLSRCYSRASLLAKSKGFPVPSLSTARRVLRDEIAQSSPVAK